MINRSAINKLLWLGVRTVFGVKYMEIPQERDLIFETRTSNQASEEDVLMVGTGYAVVQGEGQGVTYDDMSTAWTARYDHETTALALRISENAIDDNLYFKFSAVGGRSLSRSIKLTADLRAINVLNYAVDSSHLYGDGKTLLATDHPLKKGGTFANTLSAQVDISETALEELILLMRSALDDAGLPIRLTPKRLVASNQLEFELQRLMKSTGRVQTPDNDINAIQSLGIFSQPPALLRNVTNSKFWGFTTEGHDGGLIYYQRRGIRMGDDTDFDTGDFRIKVDVRDSSGVSDPRGFYGCFPT